jgi:hypothetical protein
MEHLGYRMPLALVAAPTAGEIFHIPTKIAETAVFIRWGEGHAFIDDSTELRGGTCHHSSKASGGEDLEVEQPVACGDCASFHFHAALASVLSPTLVGDQVVSMGEPSQKCLLTATWMMKSFHGEQLPLKGVVSLISQGAGDWYLRGFEDRIPARLLVLQPASHALAVGRPRHGGDVIDKMAQPLAQRKHPHALALPCSVQ